MANVSGTTGRVQRNPVGSADDQVWARRSNFEPRTLKPAPPAPPATPPGAFGDLGPASAEVVLELCATAWQVADPQTARDRRRGAQQILDYLTAFPGATWQGRWLAAGRNEPGRPINDLGGDDALLARTVQRGYRALLCLRVIQPSLAAFYAVRLIRYSDQFQVLQNDPLLDKFFAHVDASSETHSAKRLAKADLAAALTVSASPWPT